MYEFIDTIESSEGMSLPSEAVKINGEYIENQIEGYRTLTVEGREALSPEISFFDTGSRDGSIKKSKRYPARTIRITYQLITKTPEEFRAAYNKLGQILDVEDAELIFNDEQDKFFKGTPSLIGEVPPGKNSVVGEFEILCLDPFKYSVAEYEAEHNEDSNYLTGNILINYNGTYKSYPTLRAEFYNENETSEDGESVVALTGYGDCGYVAFFNESEKIIQLGDPDEVDGKADNPMAQTLINQTFSKSNSWGTAAQSLWRLNDGTTASTVAQNGTLKMGVASYTNPTPLSKGYTKILSATSTANVPTVNYEVYASYEKRTKTGAYLTIAIDASLGAESSYIGKGYVIKARVIIGDSTSNIFIKDSDYYWEGSTVIRKTLTRFVSLSEQESSLSGISLEVYRDDNTGGTAGTLAKTICKNFNIAAYPSPEPDTYYLTPNNYGSSSGSTKWHGASISRAIPADASGNVGAVNFEALYSHKMSIGTGSKASLQLGGFQMMLVDASKKIIAGVNVYKGNAGNKASVALYVNNARKWVGDVDISANNKNFKEGKMSGIKKSGQTVTFDIGGISKVFKDADIKEAAVTEMTITMSKYAGYSQLEHNGLCSVKFIKNDCDTWRDIPNKFSANDIVEADCKDGEIYLNGVPTPALGALGNDWEDFYLTPGLNQIGFAYSDWLPAKYAPKFKVKYREVFL